MSSSPYRSWDWHRLITDYKGKLTLSERVVLLVIPKWANAQGEFWPSVSTIMGATGLSRRGVQIAMKRLSDRGILVIKGDERGGRSKSVKRKLSIAVLKGANIETTNGASSAVEKGARSAPIELPKGRTGSPDTAHGSSRKCVQNAPEPRKEQQRTTTKPLSPLGVNGVHSNILDESENGGGGRKFAFELLLNRGVRKKTDEQLSRQCEPELIEAACEGTERVNSQAGLIVARLTRPDLREGLASRAEEIRREDLLREDSDMLSAILNALSDAQLCKAHAESRSDTDLPDVATLRQRYSRPKNTLYAYEIIEKVASWTQSDGAPECSDASDWLRNHEGVRERFLKNQRNLADAKRQWR